MNSTAMETILASCNQNRLLLGCRPVGNTILTVVAMGNRTDILYHSSSIRNCTHVANGVAWYYSDSCSWDFANPDDTVTRNICDIPSTNSDYRLCWHTQNIGGYRCRSTVRLNSNDIWERATYQSP